MIWIPLYLTLNMFIQNYYKVDSSLQLCRSTNFVTDRFFSEYCSNLHKMIKQGDIFKIHRIEIIYFEHFNFFFFFTIVIILHV